MFGSENRDSCRGDRVGEESQWQRPWEGDGAVVREIPIPLDQVDMALPSNPPAKRDVS